MGRRSSSVSSRSAVWLTISTGAVGIGSSDFARGAAKADSQQVWYCASDLKPHHHERRLVPSSFFSVLCGAATVYPTSCESHAHGSAYLLSPGIISFCTDRQHQQTTVTMSRTKTK